MKRQIQFQNGAGIIEILVAVAIIGIVLSALAGFGYLSLKSTEANKKNLSAVNLASESIEAVKAIKDEDWNFLAGLAAGLPYHPIKSGSPPKWIFAAGSENIDGFARTVIFENVYRDINDNIASNGNIDPDTVKITSTLSWTEQGQNKQISLSSYLANWKQ